MIQYPDIEEAISAHLAKYPALNEGEIRTMVDDFDSARPGGAIRIFCGGADPQIYNDPRIIEAFQRAALPLEMLIQHYNRGTQMLAQGRLDAAIYDFQHSSDLIAKHRLDRKDQPWEISDTCAMILNNYGYALMKASRYDEAIAQFQKALSCNPFRDYTHNNLGDCYWGLGMFGTAKEFYQEELLLNPVHPGAQKSLDSIESR